MAGVDGWGQRMADSASETWHFFPRFLVEGLGFGLESVFVGIAGGPIGSSVE